jgi:hypothetical protein
MRLKQKQKQNINSLLFQRRKTNELKGAQLSYDEENNKKLNNKKSGGHYCNGV